MILELINLLETTTIEQCYGEYGDEDKHCVFGLAKSQFSQAQMVELDKEISLLQVYLIHMNDVKKMTFKEIAQYLRKRHAAVYNVGDGQTDRPGYDGFN